MNKIILLVCIICSIMLAACGGASSNPLDKQQEISLDERAERYASFEAAIGCSLAQAAADDDQAAAQEILSDIGPYAAQFGFEAEDIPPLVEEYRENQEILAIVQLKMKDMCGDLIDQLSEN